MAFTSHAMQNLPSVTSAPPVHLVHEMTTSGPKTTPKVVISCIKQTEVAGVAKVIELAEAGENQEVCELSEAAGRGGCLRLIIAKAIAAASAWKTPPDPPSREPAARTAASPS